MVSLIFKIVKVVFDTITMHVLNFLAVLAKGRPAYAMACCLSSFVHRPSFSEFLLNLAEFVRTRLNFVWTLNWCLNPSWTQILFSEFGWTCAEIWLNTIWTFQTMIQKCSEYEFWLNTVWTVQKCYNYDIKSESIWILTEILIYNNLKSELFRNAITLTYKVWIYLNYCWNVQKCFIIIC